MLIYILKSFIILLRAKLEMVLILQKMECLVKGCILIVIVLALPIRIPKKIKDLPAEEISLILSSVVIFFLIVQALILTTFLNFS